jgi:hypothetical protein
VGILSFRTVGILFYQTQLIEKKSKLVDFLYDERISDEDYTLKINEINGKLFVLNETIKKYQNEIGEQQNKKERFEKIRDDLNHLIKGNMEDLTDSDLKNFVTKIVVHKDGNMEITLLDIYTVEEPYIKIKHNRRAKTS